MTPSQRLSELFSQLSGYSLGPTWLDAASLLLDEYDEETIEAAIRHSQGGDGFWRDKVTSMPLLRQYFPSLLKQLPPSPTSQRDRLRRYEFLLRQAREPTTNEPLSEREIQECLAYRRGL